MQIDLNKIKELLADQFESLKQNYHSEDELKDIIFCEDDRLKYYLMEEFDLELNSAAMSDFLAYESLIDMQNYLIGKLLNHYANNKLVEKPKCKP